MSNKTKLIISVLFLIQIGVIGWVYLEDKQEKTKFYSVFTPFLENPSAIDSMNLEGMEIDHLLDDMKQFKNLKYLNISTPKKNSMKIQKTNIFKSTRPKTCLTYDFTEKESRKKEKNL